jgi:hypothetical protein
MHSSTLYPDTIALVDCSAVLRAILDRHDKLVKLAIDHTVLENALISATFFPIQTFGIMLSLSCILLRYRPYC